ncbi:MAG TPA: SDR family oxidoreductase [Alphaproteobacteria bacterium]|nr:SDR family oxidoreductase [Alphaproteobacteria bacterium]
MLFCFGYGYVSRFIGTIGTSRTRQGENLFLYRGGPFSQDILNALQESDSLLISIPPDQNGDLIVPYLKEILPKVTHLKWIGYLSSTGVYGDHKGNWVDETSETNPNSPQGIARIKAEQQWLKLGEDANLPIHIFRLAGIYGPGRNVLENLKAGCAQRIFKEGVVFSRIHVEDIVQSLKASIQAPHPGRIYNLADNEPASSHEIVAYGATLLRMEPPPLIPFEDASLTAMGRRFYQDSKRVKNDRLLKELVPSLLFPTYREGLQEIALFANKTID